MKVSGGLTPAASSFITFYLSVYGLLGLKAEANLKRIVVHLASKCWHTYSKDIWLHQESYFYHDGTGKSPLYPGLDGAFDLYQCTAAAMRCWCRDKPLQVKITLK